MPGKHISSEEKKAIIKVYEYFKLEAERGRLRIRVSDYAKRTLDIFKLSNSTLKRIIQAKDSNSETRGDLKTETRGAKEKLDTFQKDLIKRSVYKFFERNEMMTIKRLRKYLIEHENLNVSKYILIKLLHQMGFKYKKDCSHSRDV